MYCIAAYNGCIGANGCPFFNERFFILMLAYNGAAWVYYIGEHYRWPKKNIIFTNYPFVNTYIILHFYIIAQYHIGRYYHILAQVTIFANAAPAHDMRKMPNFCAFAYFAMIIYKR